MNPPIKNSAELVLDEINRKNADQFLASDLVFRVPVPATEFDRNTTLLVDAHPDSKFSGTQQIWYSRVDLTEMFDNAQVGEVNLSLDGINSTLDLLPELNQLYGLALDATDIRDEPVVIGTLPQSVVLKALPGSLAFIGQLSINLEDRRVDLGTVIVARMLNGLWYETGIERDLAGAIGNPLLGSFEPEL